MGLDLGFGGSPVVCARAQERCLPQMDEVTSARIEELKAKSCAVEEKLRHAEERKRKPQERRKKEEQQVKLKREASSFAKPMPEQDGEQLRALRCRQGNAAFSAGDWSR